MSYSLGQAKLLPGQIHFQTTRTGKIPSVQPLLEAGLPIAPYIEHGSWATGQPAIMRYGRGPYRGLGQREAVEETVAETRCRRRRLLVGTGILVGTAAGAVGGLLGKSVLGGLLGAVGGGLLSYMIWQNSSEPVTVQEPATSLSGVLAVM